MSQQISPPQIPNIIIQEIKTRLTKHYQPFTPALSKRYPLLKPFILNGRITWNIIKNYCNKDIYTEYTEEEFSCVIARHQSVLRRKLGDSDDKLQEQKIINLKKAVSFLDGIVIPAGKTFSLWEVIGRPSHKNGYVDGMLLAGGKIVEGPGGGLCQLSNFLFWIFAHCDIEVIERYHHSLDTFPDSGRVLPFGSGATIYYNLSDIKIKNTAQYPIQISLAVNEKHLKGQILAPQREPIKRKIKEQFHCFIHHKNKYFRYNQLFLEKYKEGVLISKEHFITNFAPVLYPVTNKYITERNYIKIETKDIF